MSDIIIVTSESLLASVAKDIFSMAMFVFIIGIGVLLDSPAMEWAGFVGVMFITLAMTIKTQKSNKYSGQDAIDRVAELVGKQKEKAK